MSTLVSTNTHMGADESTPASTAGKVAGVPVHRVNSIPGVCGGHDHRVHLSNATHLHMRVIGGGTALAYEDADTGETTVVEVTSDGVVMSKWPAHKLFIVVPGVAIVPLVPLDLAQTGTLEYTYGRFDIGEHYDRVFVGPASTNLSPTELRTYCPDASPTTGVITRNGRSYVCVWFVTWHRSGYARVTPLPVPVACGESLPLFPVGVDGNYFIATENVLVCAFKRAGATNWCVGKYNLRTGTPDSLHTQSIEPNLCVEDSGAVVDQCLRQRRVIAKPARLLPLIERATGSWDQRTHGVCVQALCKHACENAETPAGVDSVELIRICRDSYDGVLQTLMLHYIVPPRDAHAYGTYEWSYRNESTNRMPASAPIVM